MVRALVALAFAAPVPSLAGRPLSTEDVGVVDAGRCQGSTAFSEAYVQAKGAFVEPADGRTGFGRVVGTVRRPLESVHRGWSNPYAAGIPTLPFRR